jgi:PTH1 family peptidyl-tRNA hydrolase
MKLVVFLGNPGEKYKNSRHNAGWLFAEFLQSCKNVLEFSNEKKFFGAISVREEKGEKIFFLKPMTFMNLSGKSVFSVSRFYKIQPKDILLIADDKDQALGRIRFREKGSGGGHNGIKHILAVLQSEDIPRIKIGIDSPFRTEHQIDTANFVLSNFLQEELLVLKEEIFPIAKQKLHDWMGLVD